MQLPITVCDVRAPDDENAWVLDATHLHEGEHLARQCFLYDADARIVYLGPPRMHHNELQYSRDVPDSVHERFLELPQGQINYTRYGNEVHFQPHPEAERIKAAVEAHLAFISSAAGF